MLTSLFMYLQPRDYEGRQQVLTRQREIVDGIGETILQGETAVLRALNEYGEIGKLGEPFHSPEDCKKLYDALAAAGYEEDILSTEHFDVDDPKQVICYLIGQAMGRLREGQPPESIFVVRSAMALNGVHPNRWQSTIDREILMNI
ncbi:MAG: hypothetical protein KDI61_04955 [Alphaproteobacteria bacterium]|nr:hypothetical protein [Alphaproteobacteria bacterium]MCB1839596.1 hypothetical protein [Alphaproteobacteria bacterium]